MAVTEFWESVDVRLGQGGGSEAVMDSIVITVSDIV
jgi:hypothetical protein